MDVVALISFDIDGTLECGEPPGVVSIALVRTAKRLGHAIGSGSDRPLGYQRDFWERLGIVADFTVLKHRLADVTSHFVARHYYHVGDTDTDARYAADAGFRFLPAEAAAHQAWVSELFASAPE